MQFLTKYNGFFGSIIIKKKKYNTIINLFSFIFTKNIYDAC